MKLKNLAMTLVLLACSIGASAWNCPAGQIRQQAPAGTPTTAPYYDVVEGIAFICVPTPPTTPTVNPLSSNSTSSASSTSAANAGATAGASATGGNSTATGGNASQNQKQSQTNNQTTSQNANSSASNSGNNSNYESNSSEVYNQVRQAPPAYAPTIIPSNCQGSLSGGVSAPIGGISLGGSKADKNCQRLALAAAFAAMHNFDAAARVLCSTQGAKDAHLTLAMCQATFYTAPVPVVIPTPAPIVVAPAVAPETRVILIEPEITVTAPRDPVNHIEPRQSVKPRPVVKKKPTASCPVIPDSLKK